MALNKLTDRQLQTKLLPDQRERILADGGGLYLRIRPEGKYWFFMWGSGKARAKAKVGPLDEVPLRTARVEASRLRDLVRRGIDPREDAKSAAIARKAEATASAARHTVRSTFDEWCAKELFRTRKDGGAEVRRQFTKDVLPRIGDMFADEVRRRDVTTVLDIVVQRGANRIANQLLQAIRQMFRFAREREIVSTDPTEGLTKARVGGEEREGDRVLSRDEIRELASKLSAAGLTLHAEAAIWIQLATSCRIGELSRAQWKDFNFDEGTWTIPEENSKTGDARLVHLSQFSKRQFDILAKNRTSDVWVLAGRSPDSHLDVKALQRQFRDRQRSKAIKGRSKHSRALILSGGEWRSHDLRRTSSTLMGELGVHSDVIARCQGHRQQSKVLRIYQRQELMEEREAAFERLGQALAELSGR